MKRTVYGQGFRLGEYPTKVNRKHLPQYAYWKRMLERCYKNDLPAYREVHCSEEWHCYENFYNDVSNMVGFGNIGWNLDKDMLFEGNKFYSKDTCVLLPPSLNTFITHKAQSNTNLPIGVDFHVKTGKHRVRGCSGKHLGLFDDPVEASILYKHDKCKTADNLSYFWEGKVDDRVINVLRNFIERV